MTVFSEGNTEFITQGFEEHTPSECCSRNETGNIKRCTFSSIVIVMSVKGFDLLCLYSRLINDEIIFFC